MSAKDDETLIMAAVVLQIMKIENDQMREAIAAWPLQEHHYSCGRFEPCICAANKANAARAAARKAAGLEG